MNKELAFITFFKVNRAKTLVEINNNVVYLQRCKKKE